MTENIPTAQVEAVVTINKTLQDRLKQAGTLINKHKRNLKDAAETEQGLRQQVSDLEAKIESLEAGPNSMPEGPSISTDEMDRKDAELSERDARIADLEAQLEDAKGAAAPDPEELYGPEENPLVVEAREETERVQYEKSLIEKERDSLKDQLETLEARFDERTSELRETTRDLRNQLGEVKEERDEYHSRLRKSARTMGGEDVSHQVVMSSMHAAGLEAQIIAMRKEHPDSPLLQRSNQKFEDGRSKTRLRLVYDDAFDHKGTSLGIASPNQYRP